MANRDILVIGTSAGGVMALTELMQSLPRDFKASIFIVQHITPYSYTNLPAILNRNSPIPAVLAKDGDMIENSKIYVAPPDHHMLIENNRILVKKGPKENRFRPSIDALFRSAAYVYGSRVIGIVLSGMLDDGTSGLWSIRRLHGLCIIQSPEDAEYPSMPNNVLEYVDVDYNVPIHEMGSLLHRLTQEEAPESNGISEEELNRLRLEVQIAAQDNAFDMGVLDLGPFTPFTCPECHGTLVQIEEGRHKRFRCHTGHSFTASSLMAGITKTVEENLWQTVRGLEEATMLLEQTGNQYREDDEQHKADPFLRKARETREISQTIRSFIFQQQRFSEEMLRD